MFFHFGGLNKPLIKEGKVYISDYIMSREALLRLLQKSKMDSFAAGFLVFNYWRKPHHLRRLRRFWLRL